VVVIQRFLLRQLHIQAPPELYLPEHTGFECLRPGRVFGAPCFFPRQPAKLADVTADLTETELAPTERLVQAAHITIWICPAAPHRFFAQAFANLGHAQLPF
jgi:hypothetical protein